GTAVAEVRVTPSEEPKRRLDAGISPKDPSRQLHAQYTTLQADLSQTWATVRRLQQEADEAVRTLQRALVRPLIQQAVAHAAEPFTEPEVQQYFQEVEEACNEDLERFLPATTAAEKEASSSVPPQALYEEDPFHEYQVNIIVDNTDTQGVPVVFETSPTYKNLFGTVEPTLEYGGVWRSDFMGIRAGSLHRANGGYLVFDALHPLTEPLVWATLKRTLRYGQAEIQAFDHLALVPSTTLKPEPIPFDVKVIVLGDEDLYYALVNEDAAFKRLFKVKADFDLVIPRQPHRIM